ncbi:MAG: 4Fe-4S binding protein [Anaerolineae bacterium]|nr:4Fe-4S binding protein [Anaerolineae bacterium]
MRVFGQWCKGCGLCIAFCPRNVFAAGADGHPLAVYPERCTACMWCVEHCPDFAITVHAVEPRPPARRDAA